MTRPLDGRTIENSYWFVDGQVLAGEYPGAKGGDAARARLERFLDAGVRVFIDLTEPGESGLEPYDGVLAELAAERGVEVEHRRLSIRDVSVPDSPARMAEILDAIDGARAAGALAYVHCWGGTGRTGTVVGCWYRRQGASYEDALAELRRRWGTMAKSPDRSGTPETAEQARYIRDWVESVSREDRVLGCLLGGAVGDALGAPVEFLSLAAIRKTYGPAGIRDFDRTYGRIGAITDDTQMSLFTAEGLLRWLAAGEGGESRDARPFLYRAYLRWLRTQGDDVPSHLHGRAGWLLGVDALHSPRAPGTTCMSALRSGEMGTPQRRLNDSKGCGGVMRAAPAGLIGAADPFQLGVDLAAITHSHPSGYLSAGFLALLIHEIVAGRPLGEAVELALDRLLGEPGYAGTVAAVRAAIALAGEGAVKAAPGPEAVERLGGGWVGEEALAIALYCALVHPDDYEAAVLLAVNHSGDTDSTGAIAGNIVGALLGRAAIPARWLEELELAETIEEMGEALVARYRPGPEWAERFPGR